MATIVLTALGTAIGGPIGGAVGAFIGRQADNALFGSGNRQGPRLRELNVSTSSYGQPVARIFGRMRVPGAIIWSTNLVETKRKQKGRKGQPSTTDYSYSASFAVALSSTPVERLGRIWADGNLLRGELEDLKVGGTLRFYAGHGDNQVDPLISADKGNLAPAFRDCAYVVFDQLELGDFGNRIPALSFEVFAPEVSLTEIVPAAAHHPTTALEHALGFADEGGPLAATLRTIDEVIPLVCTSGQDRLRIAPRSMIDGPVLTLPRQVAPERISDEGRHKQRAGRAAREPAVIRYYDENRDYQPGVQRALGSRLWGRELMVELPATLTASGAKQLASNRAIRARWQQETVVWRTGELDPRLQPGSVVRIPDIAGLWFVTSWEWFDRGIELTLERLSPSLSASQGSDPGSIIHPVDLRSPKTLLAVLEVPNDGNSPVDTPILFAAASAENEAWRGAEIYKVQGNALIPLGSTGSARAVMGFLAEPLGSSPALMLETEASLLVDLPAAELEFEEADLHGLAAGANRLMVGDEVIQFARTSSLGNGRWRLQGLLRGRGGTEPEAYRGHMTGTQVVLIDDALFALDPADAPPDVATRVAAMGTGDSEPVMASLANAGLSRRPLTPVHPRVFPDASGNWDLFWTRRARGQWRWDDSVEVPLVEEREAYIVGYGPVSAPYTAWSAEKAHFYLSQEDRTSLLATYGPAPLWVRQVGTFGQSGALLLPDIS